MKKTISIVIFVLSIAIFILLPMIISVAQEKEKVVELMTSNEPIKIVSFKVEDKLVKSKEKFSASKDWLKDFTVNIENTSGKTIKHLRIGLHLLRPKEQEEIPPLYFAMTRGLRDKALKKEESNFEMKPSAFGEIKSITLSANEYKNILEGLEELKYPGLEHIQVDVEEVVFDDATVWAYGSWFTVDPDNPGKLILDRKKTSSVENGAAFH